MIHKVDGFSKISKYHMDFTTVISGSTPVVMYQKKLCRTGSTPQESMMRTMNKVINLFINCIIQQSFLTFSCDG